MGDYITMKAKIMSLVLAILLVGAVSVSAFGISAPYWKQNPLKMYPGEEKDVFFNLQNCPSLLDSCNSGEISAVASLLEGSEIARITSGESYSLPFGSSDTYLKMHISIPSSASIGGSYNVKFAISSGGSGQGSVVLGTGYYVDFPVVVVEKTAEAVAADTTASSGSKVNSVTVILFVMGFVVVVLLIYWMLKRRRG